LSQIKQLKNQTGGYLCPHFEIVEVQDPKQCCGNRGKQYSAICKLNNQRCSGLPQCVKLSLPDKSKYIKQWNRDLNSGKNK